MGRFGLLRFPPKSLLQLNKLPSFGAKNFDAAGCGRWDRCPSVLRSSYYTAGLFNQMIDSCVRPQKVPYSDVLVIRRTIHGTGIRLMAEKILYEILGVPTDAKREEIKKAYHDVAKDPVFIRDGSDIYVDARISFTQAILGGKTEVPTLNGTLQIKIPKGVQAGQVLVLRGQGLQKQVGFVDHGDQLVRFQIKLPTRLTDRQLAIMEEFAKEEILLENSIFPSGNWLDQQLSTG